MDRTSGQINFFLAQTQSENFQVRARKPRQFRAEVAKGIHGGYSTFFKVAAGASDHFAMKIFPVMIQYFDWKERWTANQSSRHSNERSETEHTIVAYIYGTLKGTDLVRNCMTFSGNNCKIVFESVACGFMNSVLDKLKNPTKTA
jgi:hypothetical protein